MNEADELLFVLELRVGVYELVLSLEAAAESATTGSRDLIANAWRELGLEAAARAATAKKRAAAAKAAWPAPRDDVKALLGAIDDLGKAHEGFAKMALGHKRRLAGATLARELRRIKSHASEWISRVSPA